MLINIKSILVAVALGISSFIGKTMYDSGEFNNIDPHFDGQCIAVNGVYGPEDITILSNGIALISSDHRWLTLAGAPVQGGIYSFDLNDSSHQPVNLTGDLGFEFHPHGIGVYENKNGSARLCVVNHTGTKNSIVVFDFRDGKLFYLKTITDPLLVSPNDLVMLDQNRFYVTNDHGSATYNGKMIEDYLRLSKANVLVYDGQNFSLVADGLSYANGINMSLDGSIIYVAETIARKISVYSRNNENNTLTFKREILLGSGVDNIELDNNGSLWIGSHPKLLTFVDHAKNAGALSPSQVLRLSMGENGSFSTQEIYLSTGEDLSGSSVAAVYDNTLLIGAVFDDHFLMCSLARSVMDTINQAGR